MVTTAWKFLACEKCIKEKKAEGFSIAFTEDRMLVLCRRHHIINAVITPESLKETFASMMECELCKEGKEHAAHA
jgi:hypothetical protein